MIIKDLPITCPFKVIDQNGVILYSQPLYLDPPHSIPEQIAAAPVIRIYTANDTIYVDTEVESHDTLDA